MHKILKGITKVLSRTLRGIENAVYPALCLHCNHEVSEGREHFCKACSAELVLISPEERCPYCFSSDFEVGRESFCAGCRENPLGLTRVASALDYEGPAATIVRHLKYGGQFYLSTGCAAYMAYQFFELQWPLPDVIVPMPMPLLRRLDRGYNQSALIAESLGKLLDRPVLDIVKRRSTGFSQAGLNIQQRRLLSSSAFQLRAKKTEHYDMSILLVDDVMTTGSSLKCCAEALIDLYPKEIYGLTFCRTI